jgi:K+-sensing histidine kinase KdpD
MSSAVSHEMITPIKCILAMTEDQKNNQTTVEMKRQSDLIIVSAQLLLNQVKANLDKVLLDNKFLHHNLEPLKINEIISEICQILSVHANELGVEILL